MQDSKQLNVKLPSDLYDLILKTGRSRKDIIIDALNMYFSINEHNQYQEPQQNDSTSAALIEQLQEKDKQISELHILLQTTLNQNMITSPDDKKPWWKFWR
jgi:predicted dinucleotide-binding enzyme